MTKADGSRFARLDELFQEALARPPEERDSWLAAQADDPSLIDEVRELLREDEAGDLADLESIVESGWQRFAPAGTPPTEALTTPPESSSDAAAAATDPDRVGPYRILGRLGRGGLATVYLAERDGDFSMQVALKRIRRGMDTDDILERMRLERQILARLVHPNIGRIHDGGSDEEGRPYLVMEVIEGERVDHWCAERELPLQERLKLFLQICEAVDYAHQNLILHRDLKPSNILVTDDGTVKLLDFGIAKVLAGDSTMAQQTVTGIEHRLLTPDYASPEQILGRPLTTASDVYSLGVVLFLLISGRLPHTGDDSTLSRRIDSHHETPSVSRTARQQLAAGNRLAASAEPWRTGIDRDLDAVVGKALETEPARRYGSVRELADDIVRLLEDRPVLARRPSFGYRLLKLARRHRVGVALGTLVTLSLLIAVVGTSWSAAVASRERQRAEQQWIQAEAVAGFLVSLFEVSDPYSDAQLLDDLGQLAQPRGETVTARELLDSAARRIGGGLGGDWRRQSRLRRAIARAYFNLSLYDQARSQLKAAAEDLETVDEKPAAANDLGITRALVQRDLGWLEAREGHFDLAEERLLAAEKQLLAAGETTRGELGFTLEVLGELGLLRADPQAAETRYSAALELYRELHGERSLEVARARAGLAVVARREERMEDMRELLEQVLEVREELLGDHHPLVLETLNDLAVSAEGVQDLATRAGIFEELLNRQRQSLGSEHSDLAATLYNLADVLERLGRREEAENHLTEAWRLIERSMKKTRLATKILLLHGLVRDREGDIEGAAEFNQRALALRRELLGDDNTETLNSMVRLGHLWARIGDRRAEALLREALDVLTRGHLDEAGQFQGQIYLALGVLRLEIGQPQAAEKELRLGIAALEDSGAAFDGSADWLVGVIELRLAQALESLDRKVEALDSARRARELLTATLGSTRPWTIEAESLVRELENTEH